MNPQSSYGSPPLRRDLLDPRSSGPAAAPSRKTLLTDRRSTR